MSSYDMTGPWAAALVDFNGYVLDERDLAEARRVTVVRGSAAPYRPEGDEFRLPSAYRSTDVLYEIDNLDDEPDKISVRWGQAKAVAGALNAAHGPLSEVDRLRRLIRDLVDDGDCWFDHHGGCQAHGYLSLAPGEKCPHAEAKEMLGGIDSHA